MTKFETQTCTRCHGSGHYSYNQIDGTRCFGCNGTGAQLTKRAKVAKAALREQLTMSIVEAQVGMWVVYETAAGPAKGKVAAIEQLAPITGRRLQDGEMVEWSRPGVKLAFEDGRGFAGYGTTVRRLATDDELEAAIAHQNSLTKAGTPRKVR